jgi:predicted transcriptional regulator
MSQKELVIEATQGLPEDASYDEIIERISFMAAIQEGLKDLEQGDVVSHDEVKRQFSTCYA